MKNVFLLFCSWLLHDRWLWMADGSSWKRWIRFHDDDDFRLLLLWWWNDVSRWRWAPSNTIQPPAIHGTSRHDPTESSFSFCKRIRLSVPYMWVTYSFSSSFGCVYTSSFHGRSFFFGLFIFAILLPGARDVRAQKSLLSKWNADTMVAEWERGIVKQKQPLSLDSEREREGGDLGQMTRSCWRDWMDESHELSNHERITHGDWKRATILGQTSI